MRWFSTLLILSLACLVLPACQSDDAGDGDAEDGPSRSLLDGDDATRREGSGRADPLRRASAGVASRDAAKTRAERMADARRIAGLGDDGEEPRSSAPAPRQGRRQRIQAGNAARGIRVTWEALARERYLLENPRRGRRMGMRSPEFKIVLVNASHPDAEGMRSMAWSGNGSGGHAVLKDNEMDDFVKGLEKIGYFKASRDTQSQGNLMASENARGRVTIERAGRSVTLLSMRGQGLDDRTKHIPSIYSQSKQAIALLRNRAPTISVETSGRR